MISWIQKYFQHHFRTVFAVLLGVIIIAFVFTIGAQGGATGRDRGMVDRYFFGYNLSLQSDRERFLGDAEVSFSLKPSYEYPGIEAYAQHRAASLYLANQWHIPSPTATEITEAIKTVPMFMGQDRQFDAKAYQTFRDNLKTNPRGVTEADILRVLGDDIRMEKVKALLGGPGYVLPGEVKTMVGRADTEWTLATATADYAAFKPELKPTDAELTQFFEQSGGRYDIQPRVVVSAIDFPAMNYIDQVKITDAEVRAFYDQNPSRFPKPADPAKPAPATPTVTPPADPAADFAAVKPQVEAALKLERAQKLAAAAASDFRVALHNANVKTAEAAAAFATAKKQSIRNVTPFSRDALPPEYPGSQELVNEAFRLNKDRAVSDALSTPTGAVILVWKETQATRKPLFTEVKEKVTTDYTENERRKRFIDLGKKAKTEIETRLKAGDAFDKAVAAAATRTGLKLEAKTLAPFTLRNRPQDADYAIFGPLERLEKGQVSDMQLPGDKGVFVYAVDKKTPDVSEANPRFAETRTQIATYSSRFGASAYLTELVEKELKKSEPKTAQ